VSNNSIVEHRGSYFYVEFREEYLIICCNCTYKKVPAGKSKNKASAYCKAFILAILESWTNDKRGRGEDLAIFMSYPQWINAMYGMFGRNVIIDSLDELIGEGLISKEPYKMYGRDSFKYRLNYQELNRRIKLLPEREPHQKHPQVDMKHSQTDPYTNQSDQFTSKRYPITNQSVAFTEGRVPSSSKRNIESPKNHDIEPSKKEEESANQKRKETARQISPPLLQEKTISEKGGNPEPAKEDQLEQVEAFCSGFEKLTREMFANPKLSTHKVEVDSELYATIVQLLDEQDTSSEAMRLAFTDFWNEREKNGTYWWRDPKKLTLKAYCKHYATRMASARFNAQQAQGNSPREMTAYRTMKPIATESQYPADAEGPPVTFEMIVEQVMQFRAKWNTSMSDEAIERELCGIYEQAGRDADTLYKSLFYVRIKKGSGLDPARCYLNLLREELGVVEMAQGS